MRLRALRAYLRVESDTPLVDYSGRLVKTLALVACREVSLLHGLRGILSPLHVSPLFTPGRGEWELGSAATPYYRLGPRGEEPKLVPLPLTGEEYIIHVGGDPGLVECVLRGLERLKPRLALRFEGSTVLVAIEGIGDVTNAIESKQLEGGRVTIYFKGPSKFFNPYTPTKLPTLYPKALDVLIAPYLAYKGYTTITYTEALNAMRLLGLLVETYYSLTTVKPILVPFKNRREPALTGKATYIVDTEKQEELQALNEILNTAEIYGVGESRANGFGTIVWTPKR